MNRKETDILNLCNVLIPGTTGWPCASVALGDAAIFLQMLSDADQNWLSINAATLATLRPNDQAAAVMDIEQAEPAVFGRIVSALYRAYYSTAAAQAGVRRLAEASPQDEHAGFDVALLQQVVRAQAGKRRF